MNIIVQTYVPDFRLEVFDELNRRTGGQFEVWSGEQYFTATTGTPGWEAPWGRKLKNRFLFGHFALWQSGHFRAAIGAKVCVLELNPRILSSWFILLARKILGRPCILWGHIYPRAGSASPTKIIRYGMLWLGSGVNAYTYGEAKVIRGIFPRKEIYTSPNAVMWRRDCRFSANIGAGQRTRFLFVSRLIDSKKPHFLLESFRRALPLLPASVTLDFVGSGPCAEALESAVLRFGLTGRVRFHGSIYEIQKLEPLYDEAIAVVSPGYIGLSATQAFGFGVPMIIAREEKHSVEIELCEEGFNCEFFESNSAEQLAVAMVSFIRDAAIWKARGEGISDKIREFYSIEAMCDGYMEMFGAKLRGSPVVALVWAQFGPYHFSRLAHLERLLGPGVVIGVEMAKRTSTYQWERGVVGSEIVTLVSSKTAEELSAVEVYRQALKLFLRERVNVVLIPSYWPSSSLGVLLAARAVGARAIMMNDSHARTAKAKGIFALVKRTIVRQFDAALVAGSPQVRYFSSLGLDRNKIITGYDTVDNGFFENRSREALSSAEKIREELGLPGRYFLNIGRMEQKKNLETLIDAYQQVRSDLGADCPRLVLVGSGRLENPLRRRCLEYGLNVMHVTARPSVGFSSNADVYLMGFRQIGDLPAFYALATAFVLPSREDEWGLVVNEAMACGLPVIVSKAAGCAEDLVQPGRNGFLFDSADSSDLARCLGALARNPELAAAMGRASRQIVADWGCDRFALAAKRTIEIALGAKLKKQTLQRRWMRRAMEYEQDTYT